MNPRIPPRRSTRAIPFDFTAKPVVAPPQPPRETIHVKAIRPDRDDCEIRFPRVEGYRVELPEERLTAKFDDDSTLELTPELVGPSVTRNEGIIGEGVDLTLVHTGDLRRSTLLFHLTQRLLYTKWRDPGEDPKLHLFGQLKRVTKEWLDNHLVCKGGTYPAQLMYLTLADMVCERIIVARYELPARVETGCHCLAANTAQAPAWLSTCGTLPDCGLSTTWLTFQAPGITPAATALPGLVAVINRSVTLLDPVTGLSALICPGLPPRHSFRKR